MRFYSKIFVFILFAAFLAACSGAPKKQLTPLETLKEYGDAFKRKDITAMKLLLSQESLKMHEQEARAQNTTVDEIVKRETLFSENQKTAEFRNQKIEDDHATIEIKDSGGIWNTIHFVKEDGVWKIDKKGFANQIEQINQQKQNELDDIINKNRIDNSNSTVETNPVVNSNSTVNTNPIVNTNIKVNLNTNINSDTQP